MDIEQYIRPILVGIYGLMLIIIHLISGWQANRLGDNHPQDADLALALEHIDAHGRG